MKWTWGKREGAGGKTIRSQIWRKKWQGTVYLYNTFVIEIHCTFGIGMLVRFCEIAEKDWKAKAKIGMFHMIQPNTLRNVFESQGNN